MGYIIADCIIWIEMPLLYEAEHGTFLQTDELHHAYVE
jgi:hypothetical protein